MKSVTKIKMKSLNYAKKRKQNLMKRTRDYIKNYSMNREIKSSRSTLSW
jgi:hypothetical protein